MVRLNVSNVKKDENLLKDTFKLLDNEWEELKHLIFHDNPKNYHQKGNHPSFAIRDYLQRLNKAGRFFGVESLYPENENIWYLNSGDVYNLTIIFKNNKLYIGCVGDIIEKIG